MHDTWSPDASIQRKRSNLDAKHYRGINITPIISKILESVIRERIKPFIMESQNPLQQGFTEGSSPMNGSLILEEYIKNNKNAQVPTNIAFIDVKSVFDVVSHTSLLRKIYHTGMDSSLWNIISSLHSNARTVIKWEGRLLDVNDIKEGVQQGGIVSTDLNKVYENPLLDRLDDIFQGVMIREVRCAALACAADVANASFKPVPLQKLINTSADFGSIESFEFQLVKKCCSNN